jgi:glucose/arabinose dehydrogenase
MNTGGKQTRKVLCNALLALLLAISICARELQAQSAFAPGLRFVEEVVLKDLPISTAVAFAPEGKLFLALKAGIVRVVEHDVLLPTPFLDISGIVNRSTDRGLLGIAVDPLFPKKPYVYLSYVYDPPGMTPDAQEPRAIRISRYRADPAQGYNVAMPDSEQVLVGRLSVLENIPEAVPIGDPNIPERAACMTGLTMQGEPIEDCIPCDSLSHTAGTLIFGAERDLYASLGDGADYTGPTQVAFRAQRLESLSGRVLRLNPDSGAGLVGNPFFDETKPSSNRSRTWALGFRNPFRITIDPRNGQVYVGDVGTSYYEEINAGKGANLGWPCYEGGFIYREKLEGVPDTSARQVGYRVHPRTAALCAAIYEKGASYVTKPIYTYRHPYDETGRDLGSSITGVSFYFGTGYPSEFQGALFYADYAQHFIKYLTFNDQEEPKANHFATEVGSNLGVVQLLTGPDTNLYAVYLDLKTRTSQLRRFRYVGRDNSPPVVRAQASQLTGDAPLRVEFQADQSYDLDGQKLAYQWTFGDGASAESANAAHTYTSAGTFTARVVVSETSEPFASSTVHFTVKTGVKPPLVAIDMPTPGTTFQIGMPVSFAGRVVDASLNYAELSWTILQRHNQHDHAVAEVSGEASSFIPTEHTDNTTYELCLRATLGEGLQDQKCVLLQAETAEYEIASVPPGAAVTYVDEELEGVAPMLIRPIVGATQTISTALSHRGLTFRRWSDGVREASRTLSVTQRRLRLVAQYANLAPRVAVVATTRRVRSGVSVTLNAADSSDPEGERLTYKWRLRTVHGTRTSAVQSSVRRTVRRTVPLGASIAARLVVRDALGSSASRTIQVVTSRNGKVLLRGAVRRP